jgi:hypothetical protein
MAKNRRESKGTYGDVRLPVARAYVKPASRNRFLALGGAGLAVLAVLAGWSVLSRDAGLISNGPLTSAHAAYESDCAACHGGGGSTRGVADAACRSCHEGRSGVTATAGAAAGMAGADPPGIYTLAAHWSASPADQRRDPLPAEIPCAACHLEHRGRQAEIARVADSVCLTCHDFGSFSTGHPELDFAADEIPDSDSLLFTHSHHVNEVMRRRSLADPEAACLVCHEPNTKSTGRGGGFRPIDFDRHCAACHLGATVRTPPLPVAQVATADGSGLGVETLEAARRRGGPAERWADGLSTAEFQRFGSRVIKTPLRHRDPWVLHNLRQLRRRLYPDAGMADLLVASGDAAPGDARALYREAIATLERQAEVLRARPERQLQAELLKVEALLDELRRRVEAPDAQLDDGLFRLTGGSSGAAKPDPAEADAINALAADLTKACRQCHLVRHLTIVRVEPDQRTLRRAAFSHRPHVLQRRCLDCHDAIPITDFLDQEKGAPAAVDNSAIQNLPRIATCRACHTPRRASESCITCHVFHPDARRRAFTATAAAGPSGGGDGEAPAEEVSDAG